MKLTGAQIVLEVLKEQGVDTVFGYPGGTIIHIFDELYKAGDIFTHILTAHEQGAAHAADGYARATGKVGVCFATSGPGSTNLVTGIAAAYMDSVPMVAITCNVATPMIGRDTFQEIDITGITMPITKHNFLVKHIEDLADSIRRAFQIARSGRPGPVLVDIPKDVTEAVFHYEQEPAQQPVPSPQPKEASFERAVALLQRAEKPLIYVGGGAIHSNIGEDLITFAEKIDAPVVSTLMGLGAFPNGHPLHLGLIGMHGHRECLKAAHECDVLIACGARFSDRVTGNRGRFAPHAEILHIDIDAAEMDKNINAGYHLRGDLKDILPMLTRAVEQLDHREWIDAIAKEKEPFVQQSIDGYVNPQTLIEAIDRRTPPDTLIATDVGQHQLWVAQFYRFMMPRTLLTSGGLGAMGYSLGAAIGGKLAYPDRQVIAFVGDGGFHMNLPELATLASYHIPVKVFVMNNSVLGLVKQLQTIYCDGRFADTEPHRCTDFVRVAEAFGVKGLRIHNDDEIDGVLAEVLGYDGPTVVDCRISPDAAVLPMRPWDGIQKNSEKEESSWKKN